MTRSTRFHVDELPSADFTAKHLTKQEFGRRLYTEMLSKGWNQAELARRSDLPRNNISTYIRGASFPTPLSLQKIAKALGVAPADLMPNSVESAIEEDTPSLNMRVSTSAPNTAWLQINRLVSLQTAVKVIEMVESDTIVKEKRGEE